MLPQAFLVKDGQYIKGLRAYFLLKGAAANARSFVLDLGNSEASGIRSPR